MPSKASKASRSPPPIQIQKSSASAPLPLGPPEADRILAAFALPGPELKAEAEDRYSEAMALAVSTPAQSLAAQDFRAEINKRIKELGEKRLAITRPLDTSKKLIMDLFQGPIDMLTLCLRQADRQILSFDDQQRAEARALQERAERAAQAVRDRLEKLRQKAEDRGDLRKADDFANRQASTVAPVVEIESPLAGGTSIPTTWTFEITDPKRIKPSFMTPDLAKIGKAVRSMHHDAKELIGDGIKIIERRGVRS